MGLEKTPHSLQAELESHPSPYAASMHGIAPARRAYTWIPYGPSEQSRRAPQLGQRSWQARMSIIACPHMGHSFFLPVVIYHAPGSASCYSYWQARLLRLWAGPGVGVVRARRDRAGERVARRVRDAAVPYHVKVVRPFPWCRDGHEVLASGSCQAGHGAVGSAVVDRERPAVQGAGVSPRAVAYAQRPVACDPNAAKVRRVRLVYTVGLIACAVVQRPGRAVGGDEIYHEIAYVRVRDVHGDGD